MEKNRIVMLCEHNKLLKAMFIAMSMRNWKETVTAIIERHPDIVKEYSAVRDEEGLGTRSVLIQAVILNKPEQIDFLIDHGADVNAQDWLGETPLFKAIKIFSTHRGVSEDVIYKLIERGAVPVRPKGGADIEEYFQNTIVKNYDLAVAALRDSERYDAKTAAAIRNLSAVRPPEAQVISTQVAPAPGQG